MPIPDPTNHQFTFPALHPSSPANFQHAIKISIFFNKRDDISHDQFYHHWQTVHADLTVATRAFQSHIIRYTQHHQTPSMRSLVQTLPGANVLDYDGCAEMWVRKWDDWVAFTESDEFRGVLADDSLGFVKLPLTYMVGYENLVVGDKVGGWGEGWCGY
ncbi:hypothetical protein BO70DRAFT_432306 [Aspergillus heteromorphus CBS 117.55]|uniref:EthD domain-containing protein n=1 Tax=Aspergillus heteromorphus CBS 117.55 TaxID=1448321 RepID=A0A317V802_9EURO|nr:uncharacterized protein BO70DRAFT_432306 [Aspergillus heteromorphus CBS 117.55]PWY70266.1 hypothetical protein BO70DRAFT_432306 [Aspergillus heteromorphus CBS 117.55]